ncbi:hypothetical protein I4F81_002049 [Pyropia yezoensis]|uniref:Uncharacterized protein n=1 Tax=Pyropia yezoensis TaxID=2788 RepID=A0ACC3BPA8_PYRYE|nr:hypothetical protein I4F81_002049 [Neopyropia yezoensis]
MAFYVHRAFGGVVPSLARDAHAAAIGRVVADALAAAGLAADEVDAVGVTAGPGLEVCLRVGARAAVAAAVDADVPLVTVNHLEAHFPFLTLLVSGGHCQLLLARGVGDYAVLGGTLDDAAGEAFDKTARLLGLDVAAGGGPALEALAAQGDADAVPFPVPMARRRDLTTLVVAGGVAANASVRSALAGVVAATPGWSMVVPPPALCTDNGVMVAWAAAERLLGGVANEREGWAVRARWPLGGRGG